MNSMGSVPTQRIDSLSRRLTSAGRWSQRVLIAPFRKHSERWNDGKKKLPVSPTTSISASMIVFAPPTMCPQADSDECTISVSPSFTPSSRSFAVISSFVISGSFDLSRFAGFGGSTIASVPSSPTRTRNARSFFAAHVRRRTPNRGLTANARRAANRARS